MHIFVPQEAGKRPPCCHEQTFPIAIYVRQYEATHLEHIFIVIDPSCLQAKIKLSTCDSRPREEAKTLLSCIKGVPANVMSETRVLFLPCPLDIVVGSVLERRFLSLFCSSRGRRSPAPRSSGLQASSMSKNFAAITDGNCVPAVREARSGPPKRTSRAATNYPSASGRRRRLWREPTLSEER